MKMHSKNAHGTRHSYAFLTSPIIIPADAEQQTVEEEIVVPFTMLEKSQPPLAHPWDSSPMARRKKKSQGRKNGFSMARHTGRAVGKHGGFCSR